MKNLTYHIDFMEYRLTFTDSQGVWAVLTDMPEGKIGYEYKFKPMKATIVEDAYDMYDLHNYTTKTKEPIPKGTQVTIDCWWQNFYGCYFKILHSESYYDVRTSCVKIEYK